MKKDVEMIKVTYRGMELEISKQDYEDLKAGWISWSDLFE